MAIPSEIAKAFVTIGATLKPLFKALKLARKAVTKSVLLMSRGIKRGLGAAFKFTGNLVKKLGASIKRLAKLTIVAFLAITAAVLKMGMAFEKNVAMVSTMLSPETMAMLPEFEKGLRSIAVAFGESTATLSKGLYDILSASVASGKALGVLEISAEAAVGGMTTTAIAADTLTTVLNSYGISADRAREVSDKLFATVKKGKITYGQLASNLGKVASTAAVAGLNIDEMFAAIATMTRGGFSAEEATTSLMATLTAFIRPSKAAKKAAKGFGLELTAAALKEKGLINAVKKLNKLNTDQLGTIVENVRAFRGFAVILQDVAGYQESLAFITEKSAGTTAEAFKKMADTATFKLGLIWAKLKDIGLAIYKKYEKPFKKALDNVSLWLDENKDKIIAWAEAVYDKLIEIGGSIAKWMGSFNENWAAALGAALKKTIEIFLRIAAVIKVIMSQVLHEISFEMFKLFQEIAMEAEGWLGRKLASGLSKTFGKIMAKTGFGADEFKVRLAGAAAGVDLPSGPMESWGKTETNTQEKIARSLESIDKGIRQQNEIGGN